MKSIRVSLLGADGYTCQIPRIKEGMKSIGHILSEENPDLIPGGCIVEANSNNWDCGKCGHGWQDDTMYEVAHSEDETPIDKDETFLDRIEKLLFHKNQVVSTISLIIVAPVFLFMMALLFISMEIRIFFEDR